NYGLLNSSHNPGNVADGVDHEGIPGGLAPDQRAVLLKQRHRNDGGAGFCLGLGFLGHFSTMPIFRDPPSGNCVTSDALSLRNFYSLQSFDAGPWAAAKIG